MLFSAWLTVQEIEIAWRLDAFEQALLRRRFVREWQAERARLWAVVEARMNFSPSIARDIRDEIVEE